ncbi:MAG: class I SAM-dependent methyltransferase [Ruminococcaceae bacterium]|nr:class I SAM-dependent methyltransferase [Oscillospiraceae bacterium]
MTKTGKIVQELLSDIENKTILEAACGSAEFSIAASAYASEVFAVDLVDFRLHKEKFKSNVHFEIMDISKMTYANESFDTVFIYNAFSHIKDQWKDIERECRRVLKPQGKLYVISSWKIDTSLFEAEFGDKVQHCGDFFIVALKK